MDTTLSPNSCVRHGLFTLGVLGLPIGLLYIISRYILCSPIYGFGIIGELCWTNVIEGLASPCINGIP
jgi:hypothetical protein